MDITLFVRNRHLGGESWVDCVRVVKYNEKPVTFKLGQTATVRSGRGCKSGNGIIETLLNPCHASRFIVLIFPDGERVAYRYDEIVPKGIEVTSEDVIPGVIDPVLARASEPLL